MSRLPRVLIALPLIALATGPAAVGVPPDDPKAKPAAKGPADDALAQVRAPKGLTVSVWATEPLLQNPVAFCFDGQGRVYVAETNRLHTGVPDTRNHMYWLDDDIGSRSVADRLAMYRRSYGKRAPYGPFEKYSDQVRVVWDSTGQGKADQSRVFSGGYNRPEDGVGSGVLAWKGKVYYANIPSLYQLTDTTGDNQADQKVVLSTGYGVRVQFIGHDLHGLRMGPDGKLYFSIGDRGLNVVNKEGVTLLNPDSGAVLRCDPDGANLELVHVGLRNPQELAFDDHGNLFTYDNNSDSGDQARWVYVVEGGDSGWRCGYQYGTAFHPPGVAQGQSRGPWNTEKIWHVPGHGGGPPAYVVPPLRHIGNGPSGLTHYPGIGLSDRYKDHFFACDFTSSSANSKIWAVALKPKGASFEVTTVEPFIQGMVATDCEFGPDGAFYWSDWVGGWGHPNKGRIFKVTDPEAMKNPAVAEAKKLLAEGFESLELKELLRLLGHPHQQVRQESQLEIVARARHNARSEPGAAIIKQTAAIARSSVQPLARLHAVWALGMLRSDTAARAELLALATDTDAEIRANVAKQLNFANLSSVVFRGDREIEAMRTVLVKLVGDPEPRVRAMAAPNLGRLYRISRTDQQRRPASEQDVFAPLFEALRTNNDSDAYLRNAIVVGLVAASPGPNDVFNAWKTADRKYDTPAVRLGVVLALRRHGSEKLAEFLKDTDPRVVVEAVRAIHDERVSGAMPALAALAESSGQPDAVVYRALSAGYHIGTPDAAARVARFAARTSEPDHQRVFALKLLGDWTTPPRRDPVTGLTLKLEPRPAATALEALRGQLGGVFAGSNAVRSEAARVAAQLGLKEVGPQLAAIVRNTAAPVSARVDALNGLVTLNDPALQDVTAFALASDQPRLRAAGRSVRARTDFAAVLKELPEVLTNASTSIPEKQGAFAILASAKESPEADQLLAEWLDRADAGKVAPELLLDVLDAAESRTKTTKLKLHAPLKAKLEAYRARQEETAAKPRGDRLAPWAETVAGGDVERGREIVLNNAAVYCQRCHRIDGQGGEVGPSLNGIAAQPEKNRRYLLESVVLPSASIAKGYENVVLTLADGRVVSGVVKEMGKDRLRLVTPENKELVIPTEDIEARRTGPSAMPDDLHKKLTRRELRDVVEFLASLKEPDKKTGP